MEFEPSELADLRKFFHGTRFARRHDEAIDQARRTLDMDPNFLFARRVLAWAYEQKGMYEEAITELNKAVSILGGKVYLAHVYAVSGQRSKALDILEELKADQEHFHSTDVAIVYAGLGERDQAFAWLEKAY